MQAAARPTLGVDLARVREVVTPVVIAHGLVLVDLEWTTERSGWTLRVTVEPESAAALPMPTDPNFAWGVSLEQCAELSRDLSTALDVADAISPRYSLEVSSPGLERKLRSLADFRRFAGLLAKVKLTRPAPDGQRVLRGVIASEVEGEAIAIVADGKRIEVPFADVESANLVYELSPQPKKGAGKGAKKRAPRQD